MRLTSLGYICSPVLAMVMYIRIISSRDFNKFSSDSIVYLKYVTFIWVPPIKAIYVDCSPNSFIVDSTYRCFNDPSTNNFLLGFLNESLPLILCDVSFFQVLLFSYPQRFNCIFKISFFDNWIWFSVFEKIFHWYSINGYFL